MPAAYDKSNDDNNHHNNLSELDKKKWLVARIERVLETVIRTESERTKNKSEADLIALMLASILKQSMHYICANQEQND